MSSILSAIQPTWLFRDLLFEGQVAIAYGPPGSYKSFVTLDLCSRLVHGMDWQGRPLKRRNVVYVAGEGHTFFGRRRLAWFKHNHMPPDDDGLELVKERVNLTLAQDIMDFLDAVRDMDNLGLVVFDTLSTMIAGQDECSSTVMSGAIENAKSIARELNCAVLFIHHPGKDVSRGARGHSSLLGNIDTELCIEKTEQGCTVMVTKQKDAEDRKAFEFVRHHTKLGTYDNDGIEETSLVLEPGAARNAVDQQFADRISIAYFVTPGVPMPMATAVTNLAALIQKGATVARDRIKKALSAEWQRVRTADGIVEVRLADNGNGRAAFIEGRKIAA